MSGVCCCGPGAADHITACRGWLTRLQTAPSGSGNHRGAAVLPQEWHLGDRDLKGYSVGRGLRASGSRDLRVLGANHPESRENPGSLSRLWPSATQMMQGSRHKTTTVDFRVPSRSHFFCGFIFFAHQSLRAMRLTRSPGRLAGGVCSIQPSTAKRGTVLGGGSCFAAVAVGGAWTSLGVGPKWRQ